MKSNFIIIFSVFTLAIVFCLPKPTWGQEVDCQNSVSLVSTDHQRINLNEGIIGIKVISNDEYKCFLYKVSGYGRELISTKNGVNDMQISFSGLSEGDYTVLVHFKDTEKVICTKLQVAGIFLQKD